MRDKPFTGTVDLVQVPVVTRMFIDPLFDKSLKKLLPMEGKSDIKDVIKQGKFTKNQNVILKT